MPDSVRKSRLVGVSGAGVGATSCRKGWKPREVLQVCLCRFCQAEGEGLQILKPSLESFHQPCALLLFNRPSARLFGVIPSLRRNPRAASLSLMESTLPQSVAGPTKQREGVVRGGSGPLRPFCVQPIRPTHAGHRVAMLRSQVPKDIFRVCAIYSLKPL